MRNGADSGALPARSTFERAVDLVLGDQSATMVVLSSPGPDVLTRLLAPYGTTETATPSRATAASLPADLTALVCPPWDRRPPEDSEFSRLLELASGFSHLYLFIPAADLRLRPSRLFASQLAAGWDPELVLEGRLADGHIHPSFVTSLVGLRRRTEPPQHPRTKFFRVPTDPPAPEKDVLADLAALMTSHGRPTQWGFVHQGSLDGTWQYNDYDPHRLARKEELQSYGDTRPLGHIFTVFVPRAKNLQKPLERFESDQPLLTGRDVVNGVMTPMAAERGSSPRRKPTPGRGTQPAVELQEGDFLLPRLERVGAPSPPLLVQRKHLPLYAAHSVLVLRPIEPLDDTLVDFYTAYLSSNRSRELINTRLVGGTLDLSAVSSLPIPVPDPPLLSAIAALVEARDTFDRWSRGATNLLSGVFDDEQSLATIRRELLDGGRVMRQRRAAGELVTTLDYRVREFYPYPVAYRWREMTAQIEERAWGKAYQAILDCFETLLAYAALAGLAAALSQGIQLSEAHNLARKLLGAVRGGAALGDWVSILKQLSSDKKVRAMDADSALRTIRRVLPQEGLVTDASARLSKRRHDESHLRRLDAREQQSAVGSAREDLSILYESSGVLTDLALIQVIDNKWDSLAGSGEAQVHLLRGDHPLAPTEQRMHNLPGIEEDSLYLIDGTGAWTLLRPLLQRRQCPDCGSRSIYHPDVRSKGIIDLKAMDHGHTVPAPGLDQVLIAIGLSPGPS